ncbi:MAG: alpha/beta hydrolase [Lachnospiraceae bacterium]|nr:alpha/beta hydrolase [Lachnospiraceae bacterium]
MSTWMIVGIVILAILIVLFFGLITALATSTTHPKSTSMADGWRMETSKPYTRDLDMRPSSVYTITNKEGYVLHASFLPAYENLDDYGIIEDYDYANPKVHISEGSFAPEKYKNNGGPDNCNGQKFVIISHGYTYNRHGSIKYAAPFRKNGYNCIVYDNRRHGENEKALTTFGRDESKDLMAVIEDTRRRFGKDIALGCSGESMGTGLTITALQYKPEIDFIVADCGYADLTNVVENSLKNTFHLPTFVGKIGGVISGILFGFNYNKARPIDHMGGSTIPICFAHGGADDFILPVNSQRMHEAYEGYSEYHEYPGAGHGHSIDEDPDRYEKMLVAFLDKVYKDK